MHGDAGCEIAAEHEPLEVWQQVGIPQPGRSQFTANDCAHQCEYG